MSALNVLLSAWLAWDERPGDKRAACELVDAVAGFASEHHLTVVGVRRAMADGRRRGVAHDVILDGLTASERAA